MIRPAYALCPLHWSLIVVDVRNRQLPTIWICAFVLFLTGVAGLAWAVYRATSGHAVSHPRLFLSALFLVLAVLIRWIFREEFRGLLPARSAAAVPVEDENQAR